jgi:hypothetical protein
MFTNTPITAKNLQTLILWYRFSRPKFDLSEEGNEEHFADLAELDEKLLKSEVQH